MPQAWEKLKVAEENKLKESLLNARTLPTPYEVGFLIDWLKKNMVAPSEYDPFKIYNKNQDYDYLNAFRAGIGRGQDTGHFVDTYKFPWHPAFSTESMYYQQGMPAKQWTGNGNDYIPAGAEGLNFPIQTAR